MSKVLFFIISKLITAYYRYLYKPKLDTLTNLS